MSRPLAPPLGVVGLPGVDLGLAAFLRRRGRTVLRGEPRGSDGWALALRAILVGVFGLFPAPRAEVLSRPNA